MSYDLINSVEGLLGPRKKGRQQIENILGILKLAESLFTPNQLSVSNESANPASIGNKKKSDLHRMDKQERILTIIERFTNEFETNSLPNGVSVENYLLFLLVVLKLAKKLKIGYQRSLTFAHTLSRLNQMFVNHPLVYNRRATRDPLSLLFLVTESAQEANRNLKTPYQFEDNIFHQFIPLMTKYCMESDNPLEEIVKTLSEMPKFRVPVMIGEGHKKIIGDILLYCFPTMPLLIRIDTVTKLLSKIILEENDSLVLLHYNALKACIKNDEELKTQIAKVAKTEMEKIRHRRFVNGILEELAHPTS